MATSTPNTRADRYLARSRQAFADGDPERGQHLADIAAQCPAWEHPANSTE